jgi:hypothetical protein
VTTQAKYNANLAYKDQFDSCYLQSSIEIVLHYVTDIERPFLSAKSL